MSAVMEPVESRHCDRTGWERGEWDHEPDRIEWRSNGFACLINRGQSGALCGYVGVQPGHPWYGQDENDVDVPDDVHGGLTYSGPCQEGGHICHVPLPGEPETVWWLGFECADGCDVMPRYGYRERGEWYSSYRDVGYVRHEVESLVRQAMEAAA